MKKFPLIHKLISTSLGFGYFPYGPGTMGAIFGIILWLPLYLWASAELILPITLGLIVVFTVLGVWSSTIAEKFWGPDPSRVVMDETVGQWIALLPVTCVSPWWEILVAFVLFRFFDIVKPLGVRKMESLPGGYGIMADDILAGIYGAIIIVIINQLV
jgi:phosphatidylglycerophosphatase A